MKIFYIKNEEGKIDKGIIILYALAISLIIIFLSARTISTENLGTVEDIISVSPGGFLHPDICILLVNGKKQIMDGIDCRSVLIGDKLCLKETEYLLILRSKEKVFC